ncbi:MAG: biotin/lipoyl-containing protein [Lachnospiraceae bacterium]
MNTNIVIPRESQEMETAVIVKWYVQVGDKVRFGDPICEVESQKAAFDIETPVQGEVLKILFKEDTEVPVLQPIAVIG